MGGFIVLEDGRAYAASNWATDAVLRAVAAEVHDDQFRQWLLHQQNEFVGMGMTAVDLRELAAPNREAFYRAARAAFQHAEVRGFEQITPGSPHHEGWLTRFADLIAMIDRWQAAEPPTRFNPHMRALIPPTGRHKGPGWTRSS